MEAAARNPELCGTHVSAFPCPLGARVRPSISSDVRQSRLVVRLRRGPAAASCTFHCAIDLPTGPC
jgi:hypothetical protein